MNKIVLIEDNAEMQENIKEILELADYSVFTASNGKDGVELIKNEMPDLILCDIMMPELDGYGVLYLINKNPDTAKIQFIFLTAKSEKDDFRKGMNLGADDYLTKPFDDTELLNAIEKRLNRIQQFSSTFENNLDGLNLFLESSKDLHDIKDLSKDKRTKKINKKENLFHEGDNANFLYFIVEGKIKTYKINKDGKEFITNLYNVGDFFGYQPLITNQDHEESAAALEDSVIALIPKQDFLSLLFSSKEVSLNFIKMLAGTVDKKQEELMNLAYDTVRKRVADSLLKLLDKYNVNQEPSFTISISRDDLASIVGTATESVIRTLSEFKQDGYISIKGSSITILQPDKLKNFRF